MHVLTDDRYATRRRLVVAFATFLLVSTLVIRTSEAAFEANYSNEASAFSTGTLTLDSPTTAALFGDTGSGAVFRGVDLNAGETTTGCIDIELDTSVDASVLDDVTFEVSAFTDDATNGLAGALTIAVDLLPGTCPDSLVNATGDLYAGSLGDAATPVATGWKPTASGTRGFLISATVADTAVQGASVSGVDLTWRITTNNA